MPYPVILDSSGSDSANGRFDILTADPVCHYLREQGRSHCSDSEISISEVDIFHIIKELRDKYCPESSLDCNSGLEKELPPFDWGLVGYLGYPHLMNKDSILVRDCYIGVYYWSIVVDHQAKTSQMLLHPQCSEKQIRTLLSLFKEEEDQTVPVDATDFQLSKPFAPAISQSQYRTAFEQAMDFIEAGDCYQVNLAQKFTASCSGSPLHAYLRLREESKAPFSAYINWQSGALLSLSPERFIQKVGRQVLTQPIKGTRPRGVTADEDTALGQQLLNSSKDRAENLMIVDLLRNDLGKVCSVGSVQTEQLFKLESFSNVHHLVSSIRGLLAESEDVVDLLSSCFPGGSITGAPKLRAMEIIQSLEPWQRQVYCGTVFYISSAGNMDSNITIRTLLWKESEISCWAGGGIVSDSSWKSEYTECLDKLSSIIKALSH